MDCRKAILGVASVLALTAGAPHAAQAAIHDDVRIVGLAPGAQNSDPLFELIARTNGAFSTDAVEGALVQMFAKASARDLNAFPGLLENIRALGVSAEVADRSKEVLIALATDAADVDQSVRHSIVERLNAQEKLIILAQTDLHPHRHHHRHHPIPGEVGQVGGGYR